MCFGTTDMLFLPNFRKLTNTSLGMNEENGVVLGIYFVTAHKGALACRLDASHQPIISQ